MPYLVISTQIRLECGPTICGDEWSDPLIMKYLECDLIQKDGNLFKQYECRFPPRIVLDRLEKLGYSVTSTCGVGQTIVWTLYNPNEAKSSQ